MDFANGDDFIVSRLPRFSLGDSCCSGFDILFRAFMISLAATMVFASCCMPSSGWTLVELGCRYSPSRLFLRTNDDAEELLPRRPSEVIQGNSTFELRGIAGVVSSGSNENDTFRVFGSRGRG